MKRAKNITDLEISFNKGTILVVSDVHIPFHDPDAVKAFIKYSKKVQPKAIVLNGDIMDFFRLSRFTKGEGRNPLEEITLCRSFLSELRKNNPDANIYYVIGNHETRLERYVMEKAPELVSLIEDVFSILKVKDFNIHGCTSITMNNSFVFKHGTLLGNKSGLSAIKEIEKAYMSGCSGHTHRLAKFITRKSGRKFVWAEGGCLCDLEPEYCINPDWQQGFVRIDVEKSRIKSLKAIEIEKGEVLE